MYTFQGGADGLAPQNGVTYQDGMLYGTTGGGGGGQNCVENGQVVGCGTVFSINPKTQIETVLYRFSQVPNIGFAIPSGLVFLSGTMYGTTRQGGSNGDGSVFSFTPSTDTFATLYSFGGADGINPNPPLLYENSLFYGTTSYGGASCERHFSCGVVFSINPATGFENTLYVFQKKAKGAIPFSNLVYHAGSFIGSTELGGSNTCKHGCGLTFALKAGTGAEKILSLNNAYSEGPSGMTLVGRSIYETVPSGGGYGELLEVNLKTGQQTVLYTFTNGTDGSDPRAPLTYHDGAFYGTTDGGNGTIFKFVP